MTVEGPSPHNPTGAARYLTGLKWRADTAIWLGMLLFVSGWSLIWASALRLVPYIPIGICPILMLAGLAALMRSSDGRRLAPSKPLDDEFVGRSGDEQVFGAITSHKHLLTGDEVYFSRRKSRPGECDRQVEGDGSPV
jgi:hypothetical protein